MALAGRRRDWVRQQGRANAALLLLARDLDAEFVAPEHEKEYAHVEGRTKGCTFELRVAGGADVPTMALTMRHFHAQQTVELTGAGCILPQLDPGAMRSAIEHACERFATSQ